MYFILFKSKGLLLNNGFSLLLYANSSSVDGSNHNSCKCGTFSKRIVGGFIASPNSYPYQIGIMLVTSTIPFCGGTIISTKYVLTAAHCTKCYARFNGLRVSISDADFTVN